jgi:hypothetical protein
MGAINYTGATSVSGPAATADTHLMRRQDADARFPQSAEVRHIVVVEDGDYPETPAADTLYIVIEDSE